MRVIMFRKVLSVAILLVLINGLFAEEIEKPKSFVANGERYDFESFDQNKVPSLIKECFPNVTFYISRMFSLHMLGEPEDRDEDIVAVFKGKKYWIAHFNKLWLDAAKDKKDLNKMLKSYVLLRYWRDTFHLKHYKEKLYYGKDGQIKAKRIPPKYNKIEVSDLTIWSKKYSDYYKTVTIRGVLYVSIDSKKYKWIVEIKGNQIFEIKSYNIPKDNRQGESIGPKFYSIKTQKDVYFEIVGGTFQTQTMHDTVFYYVKVSENNINTGKNITIRVTGLNNNEKIEFFIISKYGYTENDSIRVNKDLTANSSGICKYTWQPPNGKQTGLCKVKIIRENKDITYWKNHYIIPEHVKTGTFDGGYNYEIHHCNQFFAEYVKTALIKSWKKQVDERKLAESCSDNEPIDLNNIYKNTKNL